MAYFLESDNTGDNRKKIGEFGSRFLLVDRREVRVRVETLRV